MDVTALPHEWPALALIALLLGLRHGYDADHLAAVDGITRSCSIDRPALATSAGMLFSLGHGLIVMSVALVVSFYRETWAVPTWLENTGAWISISALLGLGVINGYQLWSQSHHHAYAPVGWRSQVFRKLLCARHPSAILGVGALFALSFDTISQATLFAMAATKLGGWVPTVLLAAVFTLGMVLTDGLNGAIVANLIRRADQRAHHLSRAMGWAVVIASVVTGLIGLASQISTSVDQQLDSWGWLLSLSVMGCVLIGFVVNQLSASSPHELNANSRSS